MPNRQPRHDFSPRVRKALWEGMLKHARAKGITLSELAAQWWAEDWKKTAELMLKFAPVEKKVSGEVVHKHDYTVTEYLTVDVSRVSELLERATRLGEDSNTPPPLPN